MTNIPHTTPATTNEGIDWERNADKALAFAARFPGYLLIFRGDRKCCAFGNAAVEIAAVCKLPREAGKPLIIPTADLDLPLRTMFAKGYRMAIVDRIV